MATEGKAPFRSAWAFKNRARGRSLNLLRTETRLPVVGSTLWLNWWLESTGSAQTLTLTLLDDSVDTFYGATLSHASPQSITLTLLDDSADTFYGATLSHASPQTLTLTLLDDSADTFYGLTISKASAGQTLTLDFWSSLSVFYPLSIALSPDYGTRPGPGTRLNKQVPTQPTRLAGKWPIAREVRLNKQVPTQPTRLAVKWV